MSENEIDDPQDLLEDAAEDIVEEIEFDDTPDMAIVVEEIEVVVEDTSFYANLATRIDDSVLDDIGFTRQEVLTNLRNARSEWEDGIKRGIKWLGINTSDAGNTDIEGSCTAVHPLLIENVVKFQAKAIQELWPAKGPVRTKIKGYVDEKREAAAARVRTYMNYQLTEKVDGFYADLERNLFRVGFIGTGIRKAGWNSANEAPDPTVVHIENFFVDPAVSHLRNADEYVEVMEITGRKMRNLVAGGQFIDYGDADAEERIEPNEITEAIAMAQGFDSTLERKGFVIAESHCYLDLNGDDPLLPEGGSAPYIVHFNVQSGKVYAIRRNWRQADPAMQKRLWYTVDHFIPAFGFYGLGYVHLIGDLTAASTAALRALVDAGQLANWQGGFKSQDAKFSNSDTPIGFGEFRDVNLPPEDLQRAFLPLPAKEPSQTLLSLLQFMVGAGQKFADAADEVVQNGTNYGPAATTLALLEASGRFYSSIHKRLHQSQQEFFKIIGELNYEYLPETTNFVVGDENQYVQRDDFNPEIVDIIPASDPNALSETQRVARAQIELEIAARFPQLHDMREVLRRFYSAMGTDAIDKLLPDPEEKAVSADPMTEIQVAMQGKPIKAKMGQNHMAHVAVKEAFLQAPQMQGTNDPTVAVGKQLLMANIAEHKVLMFVSQMMLLAQQNGLPVQDENVQAQIAQQLLMASAQSGMGGQQGPSIEEQMLELNKAELQIAQQRIQSQDTRESAKLALKQQELQLKRMQMEMEAMDKQRQAQIAASGKILDNNTKLAQIAQKELMQRVQ